MTPAPAEAQARRARPRRPREFDAAVADHLQAVLDAAVVQGHTPGVVVRVGWIDETGNGPPRHAHRTWVSGRRALQPVAESLDENTVYDIASLTKGVVTATLLAQLMHEHGLGPDTLLGEVFAAWQGDPDTSLRHLLTHTSGLPAGLPPDGTWSGAEAAVQLAAAQRPTDPPGTRFRYSDVNFILLGAVAQQLGGQALDVLADRRVLIPLGMRHSGFVPVGAGADAAQRRWPVQTIAPTEWEGEIGAGPASPPAAARMLRGVVHDPTARRMGGVAGHAGLFSTVADLDRYARMLLGRGSAGEVCVLAPQAFEQMVAVASPEHLTEKRNLGWDMDTPLSRARGREPRPGSFGHTGFTGCALWIDPPRRMFHVLLSNRVHPVARQSIVALYEEVGTLAMQGLASAR